MEKYIELPQGFSEAKVIKQVDDEYSSSVEFTNAKRESQSERMKLYINNKGDKKQILSKLIWKTVQTFISLYFVDKPITSWVGRQFGDGDFAYNLNALGKFDYDEMDLATKKRQVQEDKILHGVAIEVIGGWNDDIQCPEAIVVNPMHWICDTYKDVNSDYRFHGFELEANLNDLKADEGYSNRRVEECRNTMASDLIEKAKQANIRKEVYLRTYDIDGNPKVGLYHHYTEFNGIKYHLVLGANRKVLLRCTMIKPKTKAQRKNPRLVKFPVVVRNWIPHRDDTRGVNIFDILEDKQVTIQLFRNLARIKAEYEARGDLFLVDETALPDLSELQKVPTGPRYAHADLSKIANPIFQVQKAVVTSDVWNLPNVVQQDAYSETGIDERSMGVSGDGNITAEENKRVQANANLRIMLGIKEDKKAEKIFWELWREMYSVHFSGKKIFQLTNDRGQDYFEITKNDIGTDKNIDVVIELQSEIDEANEKKKIGYMTLYSSIISDPTISEGAKRYVKRKALEYNGVSRDEVERTYPETWEEEQALMDVIGLNEDKDVGEIEDLSEDHDLFIMIYDTAKDTPAKKKAIAKRRKAKILFNQQNKQQTQQQGQPQDKAMSNMLTNNMIQQDNKNQTQSLVTAA